MVLTENGFLHCFCIRNHRLTHEDVKSRMNLIKFSIFLRRPHLTIARSTTVPHSFEIHVPKPSVCGLFAPSVATHTLKAGSDEELNGWMESIEKYLAIHRDPPAVEETPQTAAARNSKESLSDLPIEENIQEAPSDIPIDENVKNQ